MERQLTRFARSSGMADAYRVEIAHVREAAPEDTVQRSLWDKCLGIATMVVVSVGGWAGIIELVRWLK